MKKQHKEDTFKVSGRSVVFSAFYADLCLCPKLVIITTLTKFGAKTARYAKISIVKLRHSTLILSKTCFNIKQFTDSSDFLQFAHQCH